MFLAVFVLNNLINNFKSQIQGQKSISKVKNQVQVQKSNLYFLFWNTDLRNFINFRNLCDLASLRAKI